MAPVVSYVAQLVLGILVPWAILRFDLSRLPAERLDHAWPEVSFWMSLVAFGPLCLPFHFTKTRKNRLIGLCLGFFWLAVALFVLILLGSALDSILERFS
jgi:hypothetical protein